MVAFPNLPEDSYLDADGIRKHAKEVLAGVAVSEALSATQSDELTDTIEKCPLLVVGKDERYVAGFNDAIQFALAIVERFTGA